MTHNSCLPAQATHPFFNSSLASLPNHILEAPLAFLDNHTHLQSVPVPEQQVAQRFLWKRLFLSSKESLRLRLERVGPELIEKKLFLMHLIVRWGQGIYICDVYS